LRSLSHYVKISIAIRQIERQPGKQNNQIQPSTTRNKDKFLSVSVTGVSAAFIITVVALHRYGENLYRAVDLDADTFAFMIWPTPAANPVRISLILPVYNVAKYLLECLQSVIDQSFAVSIWSEFGVS
jgi:hypothetical protein